MTHGSAAPESGNYQTTDPEILALLDFEPVPRKIAQPGAWTPEVQRQFIARLAVHGSPGKASEELGKDRGGARKLYKSPEATSFRAAWDAAIELAGKRKSERFEILPAGGSPPTIDYRRKLLSSAAHGPALGQVPNEFGEWEDQASLQRRGEDAGERIALKLLRCRRMFLAQICDSPGKRAAFEILTELPIDWEKAEALEPQPDEPWRRPNMRDPDMVLTAESGWLMGEAGYGPDRKAQMREALNHYRAEKGLEPVKWESESAEDSDADA